MHVAAYESLDKTATESDNSPALIKSNYLGIVTREDGAKYWAIRRKCLSYKNRSPYRSYRPQVAERRESLSGW
jgi:hypothetical protein